MSDEIKEIIDAWKNKKYILAYTFNYDSAREQNDKLLDYIISSQEEIERLNNKYNKALELLSDYNMPCEYDEGIIPDDYCEENCSDDYKKCWNKYIELELKGDSSSE